MLTLVPVFKYVGGESTRKVSCLICPKAQGRRREFSLKHLKSHQASLSHQRYFKVYTSGRTTLSGFLTEKEPTPPPPLDSDLPGPSYTLGDPESMDIDDPQWIGGIPDESEPISVIREVAVEVPPETHDSEDDQPALLSELWQAVSTSRQQRIDGTRDLFGELQDALASGEAFFSTSTSPPTMSPNDDNAHDIESDFGIELPGE